VTIGSPDVSRGTRPSLSREAANSLDDSLIATAGNATAPQSERDGAKIFIPVDLG
jgi:hypothetical protein